MMLARHSGDSQRQPAWVYNLCRKKGVCPELHTCNKWRRYTSSPRSGNDARYIIQKGRKWKAQVIHVQRMMPYRGSAYPPGGDQLGSSMQPLTKDRPISTVWGGRWFFLIADRNRLVTKGRPHKQNTLQHT